jgi:hypothetical protein
MKLLNLALNPAQTAARLLKRIQKWATQDGQAILWTDLEGLLGTLSSGPAVWEECSSRRVRTAGGWHAWRRRPSGKSSTGQTRSSAEAVCRGGAEKPIPSKIESESLRSKGKLNLLLILHKFQSIYRESSVEPFHNSFRIRHDKHSLIMDLDPRRPAG